MSSEALVQAPVLEGNPQMESGHGVCSLSSHLLTQDRQSELFISMMLPLLLPLLWAGAPVVTNNPDRKVQEDTQGRSHLLGDPGTHSCSLDIGDARKRDKGKYFFQVERGKEKWTYVFNRLSVHVMGTLEAGHPKNLTCSVPWACEWATTPIFSWTSAALTSLDPRTHFFSVLTLTPWPQDHGTNVTCQVKFPAASVTMERTIQPNVTCAPENPEIGVCLGDGTEGPEPHATASTSLNGNSPKLTSSIQAMTETKHYAISS
ncbi:hypothetical protein HPG69_014062 [Diceros bicornis minor]|uniref:Myeloid cell surface antigen CD33 n=1 Tax=Diceros bicornis minor TaxID=77932 RepID=A0A7J7ENC6_DICBM|nr:hypothetical protein HPG69_014062 [Diceros bicornis minor]